jgi:thiol-disulfide isomerase/thioredoxin
MSLRRFLSAAAVGMSLSVGALAQNTPAVPAAGDPVAKAIESYNAAVKAVAESGKAGRERAEAMSKAAADAVGSLKLEELSVDGYEKLADQRLLGRVPTELQKRADERLATLAKESTAEGARAAMLRSTFNPSPATQDEESWKAYQLEGKNRLIAAMSHPGLAKAAEAGKTKYLFSGSIDGKLADSAYADALGKVVDMPLPPDTVQRLWYAYLPLADEGATATPEAREKIRAACSAKVAKVLGTPSEAAPGTPEAANKDRTRKAFEDELKSFEGAFAKGKLVGYTAPEIAFDWTNLPGGAKKLSDLKGKVVVIDFWATWCGPCVGSFPMVRDLQARYKDYPVVIVGVTDMQGTPAPKTEPGKSPNYDAAVQFPALAEWSKDDKHLMTWPIAVGSGNVFNPEYGVMGIPHVVILDPEGKVRYRGLHPAMEPEKKHGYIDGILKEFKLPAPTN